MHFDELSNMDPFEFETFTGQVFAALGYNVLVTSRTADGGVDLILDMYDGNLARWIRNVVQVKRYRADIGIEKIRELNGILGVHAASFGTLVTLSGYRRGIIQKARVDFPNITLIDRRKFKELVKNAGMMTPDEDIILSTDPNLENNRRAALLRVLRSSQPKGLTEHTLIKKARGDFLVTASDAALKGDIAALIENGAVIQLDRLMHYAPRPSEIQIALSELPIMLQDLDYFVSENTIIELLVQRHRMSEAIWREYFSSTVERAIEDLVRNGILRPIGEGLYATTTALKQFREAVLDSATLRANIAQLLGIDDEHSQIRLADSPLYPSKDQARMMLGTTKDSRKLLPFLNILFNRCNGCDLLHVHAMEMITLLVTTDEIDRVEKSLPQFPPAGKILQLAAERFNLSHIFAGRINESFARHFNDPESAIANVGEGHKLLLTFQVDVSENETLAGLLDRLFSLFDRYQSFQTDIYSPIPGFGRPRPRFNYGGFTVELEGKQVLTHHLGESL